MSPVIHPDVSGPTHAESPYTRKLKRFLEDAKMIESISPLEHKGILTGIIFEIESLIQGGGKN